MRVNSAIPTSTPVATTHRSGWSDRRASSAVATAARTSGTNSASEMSAVLMTTSGGAMAAMPTATTPTRRPQMRAAIRPMRPTDSVPSSAPASRATGGASCPATA